MKRIAIVTTLALVAAGLVGPAAHAEPPEIGHSIAADSGTIDDQALSNALAAEDVELDDVSLSPDELVVDTFSELGSGANVSTKLALDLSDSSATVSIDGTGSANDATYSIDIDELAGERIVFTANDAATGAVEHYDSAEGVLSIVPLILGIPLVVTVLEALIASALVMIMAGATWVAATEAIKAINSRGSSFQHFAAERKGALLMLSSGMSLNQAIARGRASKDTWSTSSAGAYAVAWGIKRAKPVGSERDAGGRGKYEHFHPSNRTPPMHAFFGGPN